MAVNKVIYGDQTVIDISDTTAEPNDVIRGKTFYAANGELEDGILGVATTTTDGLMSAADKMKLNAFGNATDYALATQIPSSAVFSVNSVQNAYTTEPGVTARKYGNVYAVNINCALQTAFPANGAQTTIGHINNWPSSLPSILLNIPAQTDGSKIMIYWVKPSGDITIQSVTGAPKSTYRGSGCVINS